MDDQVYDDVLRYLTKSDHSYPEEIYKLKGDLRTNTKFRQVAKPYTAQNGTLFHHAKEVLPQQRLKGVLEACHDNPTTGGHFATERTYQKIAAKYYWKGMKKDIESYCKACETCVKFNPKITTDGPPLHSMPVPEEVWSQITIDLMGPFQMTQRGNHYIVAVTDHFSKWTEADAYPDKSADSVADFLYKTVCRLGCFDILISDQGREFINTIIDNLMTKLGTEHRVSSPYHPQTNGQRKQDNRTLKNALSKLVNDRGDNWDVFIPGVLFAHHTSVHASTKMTPFECMYIRKAKLPMDIKDSPTPKEDVISDDFLQAMQNLRQNITSKVSNNITKAKKIQKEQHDKLHNSHHELELGTIVYLKNSCRINSIGAKLEPRFLGPFGVHQVFGKGRVKLKSLKSGQVLCNTYHGSNLKRHTPHDVFPTNHTGPTSRSSYARPTTRSTKTTISTSPSCRTSHTSSKSSVSPTVPHHTRFMSSTIRTSPMKSKKLSITTSNPPPKRPHCSFQPMTILRRRELCKQLHLPSFKSVYFGREKEFEPPKRQHKTKGDGNCFFRAISYFLTGQETFHLPLRDAVVQHMCEKGEKLENYLQQNVTKYLDSSRIAENGVWATDAEIMATASLLQTDIVVYTHYGKELKWLCYPASFTLEKLFIGAVYLTNLHEHFDVVINVQ